MTEKFNKFLAESGLPKEVQTTLLEAWETKLSEARDEVSEQVRAELREEFSKKFNHDKEVMIESMQQFLESSVKEELAELAEDKKQLSTAAVSYRNKVSENLKKFNDFLIETLSQEIKEHRADSSAQKNNLKMFESFALEAMAKEVKEIREDRLTLSAQRVKLIAEGKKHIAEAKKQFLKSAAQKVEEGVNKQLTQEIQRFRSEINEARQNEFGKKIFEAFASEYMTSYLNDNSVVSEFKAELNSLKDQLVEAQNKLAEKDTLLETANTQAKVATDRLLREKTMATLLSPLPREKKNIMVELLETVKTENLERVFNKYLPAVLQETHKIDVKTNSKPLTEGVARTKTTEKTGDRVVLTESQDDAMVSEIEELRRLAGNLK